MIEVQIANPPTITSANNSIVGMTDGENIRSDEHRQNDREGLAPTVSSTLGTAASCYPPRDDEASLLGNNKN